MVIRQKVSRAAAVRALQRRGASWRLGRILLALASCKTLASGEPLERCALRREAVEAVPGTKRNEND